MFSFISDSYSCRRGDWLLKLVVWLKAFDSTGKQCKLFITLIYEEHKWAVSSEPENFDQSASINQCYKKSTRVNKEAKRTWSLFMGDLSVEMSAMVQLKAFIRPWKKNSVLEWTARKNERLALKLSGNEGAAGKLPRMKECPGSSDRLMNFIGNLGIIFKFCYISMLSWS